MGIQIQRKDKRAMNEEILGMLQRMAGLLQDMDSDEVNIKEIKEEHYFVRVYDCCFDVMAIEIDNRIEIIKAFSN